MDHDQRRHEGGPEAPRLARPKPQEHEADDDEHHDARPRDGRDGTDGQSERTRDPAALSVASREVDGERHEHDKRGAECDRVLGRAEDAEPPGSDPDELGAADRPAVQERDHAREVVEDVEAGARLDDGGDRDDGSSDDERLRKVVDVLEPSDHAHDQVEDEHEAQEEHEALVHERGHVCDPAGFATIDANVAPTIIRRGPSNPVRRNVIRESTSSEASQPRTSRTTNTR